MDSNALNCVISIAEHELEMSHRWFDWVTELGGTDGHDLYLIPAAGLAIPEIISKASTAFRGRVKIIKDEEGQTSDWQKTEPMRSASGPNSAFRQVAWHFYMNRIGPWFWCELDCIPTKREWLDRFESEYKIAVSKGKKFLAAQVLIETVPEHASGNAVYPMNVPEEAPTLVQRANWIPKGQSQPFELAFDIAGAREMVPKTMWTNLIQHKFRFKGFESRAEFDAAIDPNAVVFHSDKKGTVFQYLRENLSGGTTTDKALACGERTLPQDGQRVVDQVSPSQEFEEIMITPEIEDALVKYHGLPSVPKGSHQISASDKPKVESRTFAPSDELETVIKQNSVIRNGLPAMSPPWENREDSERDVKMLCDALALFAKAPVYKARVRQALREAKIIK